MVGQRDDLIKSYICLKKLQESVVEMLFFFFFL